VLEVGTLAAYSTIWLGRARGVRRVVSLELDAERAALARANVDAAGLGDVVDVRAGDAVASLAALRDEAFDLAFIDADKQSNVAYFNEALRLSRPGSLIVVDNVVRDGKVVDAHSDDARVQGVRALVDAVAAEPRVSATAIQTVGRKGWDGFMLIRVLS